MPGGSSQILVDEHPLGVRQQRITEPVEAPRRDPHPGSVGVAAEADEHIAADVCEHRAQSIVQLKRFDAAATATAPGTDDHRRTAEALDEPRSDDADDARVPALVADDDRFCGPQADALLDLLDRLLDDLLFEIATGAVFGVEHGGEALGFGGRAAQQLDPLDRIAEPTCSIDARAELKAEMPG